MSDLEGDKNVSVIERGTVPDKMTPASHARWGRFAVGNQLNKGKPAPHARRIALLRAVLFKAATPADMLEASRKMVEMAKEGDRAAYAEIMDRTVGKAVPSDLESRMHELEQLVRQVLGKSGGN